VRACRDVRPRFGDAPFRQQEGACSLRMRNPVSCPSLRQRAADPERLKKASDVLHRLATGCGQQTVPPVARAGLVPTRTASKRGLVRTSAPLKMVAGSSMEGTSGAADRGLLRGRACDAALDPGCVRASDASAPWRFDRAARLCIGRPAGGPAQAGRRGSASSYPSRGWRSWGGIVIRAVPERVQRLATSESPVDAAAISRREVSERIGLG